MGTGANYRRDIDGLRAVAVVAVLLHHLSPSGLSGGYVGVDVFFVISGYLITGILRKEIESGTFRFTGFYERRARRIFPALFAMLGATMLSAHLLLLPSDLRAALRAALGTAAFLSNVVFWRDLQQGYFAPSAEWNPLLHTWSLGVEEQFYLAFPVLLILLHHRRRVVAGLAAVAVVTFVASSALLEAKPVAVFFLSPFRAWELLAGALLAYWRTPATGPLARESLSLGGLAMILGACWFFTPETAFPGMAAALPVAGSTCIILAGTGGSSMVTWLLGTRPAVFIGLISYSLYLWHWPLIAFTRYWNGPELTPALTACVAAASVLLAWLSYRFIEQPFRRAGAFSRRSIFIGSGVAATILAIVGVAGLAASGYPTRFRPQVVALDQARDPTIPFRVCDGRPIGSEHCSLGTGLPATLLWGDSHMLAWAPAFQGIQRTAGTTAVLAVASACPPIFEPRWLPGDHRCALRGRETRAFLDARPEVHTIVLSAYWSTYYQAAGDHPSIVSAALVDTIQRLRESGRRVLVLGPVPTHAGNVPLLLALQEVSGRILLNSDASAQFALNRHFYSAIATIPGVEVLDPIGRLCNPSCETRWKDRPLYRDANHLSVDGALYLEGELRQMLRPSDTAPRTPSRLSPRD